MSISTPRSAPPQPGSRSANPARSIVGTIIHQPYIWAIVTLLLLLVINLVKDPTYLGV